jgi:cell division septation protein DedD
VTRAVAPPPPPARQSSGPLSLTPDGISQPPSQPRAAPAAQQPLALAAVPPTGGSYAVQVSSQRSEAEANASYKALQARYPSILGGRSAFVRRADLGSRGTYYRSMVGPFVTAEEATQFCSSLKSAGGQCIIHRN